MSAFTELVAAIDGLTALETGVASLGDFDRRQRENAAEIDRWETVVAVAGTECKSLAHMRNLFNLTQRYGLEHRTRVWCSVAGATMRRTWVGLNGWEA